MTVKHLLLTLFFLTFALCVQAIQPELTADKIEADLDNAGAQIARGNVRLSYGEVTVFADLLRYYEKTSVVEAEGNIILDSPLGRTKAATLSIDLTTGQFSMTDTTLAKPPFYMSSASATGDQEKITMSDANASYGQPDVFSPNLASEEITYFKSGRIETTKTFPRVGILPIFYVPSIDWDVEGGSPFRYYGDAGYRGDLGAFLKNKFLYRFRPSLYAGASVDLYSERGFLLGPELEYHHKGDDSFIFGTLSAGYIDDQGDTELDLRDRPIDAERGFVSWTHRQRYGQWGAIANLSYWSDSEVLRDFRPDEYDRNQQPVNFIEIDYLGENTLYSLLSVFSPNDFQNQVTRLPQLRVDLLTSPILQDQYYHKGFAEFSRLKYETADNLFSEPEVNRFDAYYGWNVDYKLQPWATLTGIGGTRLTHYDDTLDGDSFTRLVGEIGFDLRIKYEAIWEYQNERWGIDGLRHLAEPVVQYRYIPAAQAGESRIFAIDRNLLENYPPLLDISDMRFTDDLDNRNLLRLGHENRLQTRHPVWGSRTLAKWNFYQDVNVRPAAEENTLDQTYSFIELSPIHWFALTNFTAWDTVDFSLRESHFGVRFEDGDIWSVSADHVYIEDSTDQIYLRGQYRISERLRFLTSLRYDLDAARFTKYGIGVRKTFGHAWDVLFTLARYEGSLREEDIEFRMQVNLLKF